jgi:hypothetical protein
MPDGFARTYRDGESPALTGEDIAMNDNAQEDVPARTAGQLRRRLAALGDPWSVDPALNDDDPLPQRSSGGQPDDEVPSESRLDCLDAAVDLREVLVATPPANPSLRARWIETGLLAPDAVGDTTVGRADLEGGS